MSIHQQKECTQLNVIHIYCFARFPLLKFPIKLSGEDEKRKRSPLLCIWCKKAFQWVYNLLKPFLKITQNHVISIGIIVMMWSSWFIQKLYSFHCVKLNLCITTQSKTRVYFMRTLTQSRKTISYDRNCVRNYSIIGVFCTWKGQKSETELNTGKLAE